MKKKLFFCSDLHGYYLTFREAIDKAGFNPKDESHLLVILGDLFDRGCASSDIYKYVRKLESRGKAYVLNGNHGLFLIKFLQKQYDTSAWNYFHNGLDETIGDLLHQSKPFEKYCLHYHLNKNYINSETFCKWQDVAAAAINNHYPGMLEWLKTRPKYFESKHYIGVHGAIDVNVDDWHEPNCKRWVYKNWDMLDFDDGSFFGSEINNTDKTVIIGHFGTSELRRIYAKSGIISKDNPDNDYDILYRDDGKVIAIDGTTVISEQVNVLVVEDEMLEDEEKR